MPSTATITAFYSFTARTKIKSAEVNDNFSLFRGHLLPISPTTATAADNTYDIGASSYLWRTAYLGNLQLATNGSPPGNADTGYVRTYFKTSDKFLYAKDSSGTERKYNYHFGQSYELDNLKVDCTVTSNALTINWKTLAGTSPSASDPVTIGFMAASTITGTFVQKQLTAATALTITSSMGHVANEARFIYAYLACDSGGNTYPCASSTLYPEHQIVSLTTTVTDLNRVYAASSVANVRLRRCARLRSNQATPGTYVTAIDEVKIVPFSNFRESAGILVQTAGSWAILNNANHIPYNVSAVATSTTSVRVDFGFTAVNVVTFQCNIDNEYAPEGIFVGASVGLGSARIEFSQVAKEISGYIYYSSPGWEIVDGTGGLAFSSFTSGDLSLVHNSASEVAFHVTGRGGVYIPMQSTASGSLSTTQSKVSFYDFAGTKATVADANMRFTFSRKTHGYGVRPNTTTQMSLSGSAIFFRALLEE